MIKVSAAQPGQQETVLRLMFAESSEQERSEHTRETIEASQQGQLCLDGLLMATIDGETVGSMLYVMQPGATAFVWPPAVCGPVSVDAVVDALFAELRDRIDEAGAWIGQCLVELQDTAVRRALVRNEFVHLADLLYLQRSLVDPVRPQADIPFQTVTFDPASNHQLFISLLEQTYAGTLDCPSLNGMRTGAEALASHQASGEFDPSRWKIYRVGQADVGILLLNDQPEQNAWELVYMGIVPEARGKGYGRTMLLSGLQEAKDAGRASMLLAVDNQNNYAKRVYGELQFVEQAVRAVHVRMGKRRRGAE